MPATPYLKENLGNLLLREGSFVSPGQVYLGLATDITDEGETITEVSGGSYARQAIDFAAPVDGVFLSSGDIEFPVATANWGTVTYAVLYDASVLGNALWYAAIVDPRAINTGATYEVLSGDASFTF